MATRFVSKGTYTVVFVNEGDRKEHYSSLEEALATAAKYVGNNSYREMRARVTSVISGADYRDKIQRISISFYTDDTSYNCGQIVIPNLDAWQLDDELTVTLTRAVTLIEEGKDGTQNEQG